MSCGVGCRHSSDPLLLWLWCRLSATAPNGPLAWEPPYAVGAALEKKAKRPKKNKTKQNKKQNKKVDSGPLSFLMAWLVDQLTSSIQILWAASEGQKSFNSGFKGRVHLMYLNCFTRGKKAARVMVNYRVTVAEWRFRYRVLALFPLWHLFFVSPKIDLKIQVRHTKRCSNFISN